MNIDIKTHLTTRFWYRGISVEITHPYDSYKFCCYFYLVTDKFEDREIAKSLLVPPQTINHDKFKNLYVWDYSSCEFLNSLPFHGGVTYYEKIESPKQDKYMLKVGCDYAHCFDTYTDLDMVVADAIEVINELHSRTKYTEG